MNRKVLNVVFILIVCFMLAPIAFAQGGFNGGRTKAKFLGREIVIYGLGNLENGEILAFPFKKIYNNTILQIIEQQESEDEEDQPIAMNYLGINRYLDEDQFSGLKEFTESQKWICGIKILGYDRGPMVLRNLRVYDTFANGKLASVFSMCINEKDRRFLFDPSFVLDGNGFRDSNEPVIKKKRYHKKKKFKKRPARKPMPAIEYEPGLEIEPDNGG